MEERNYHSITHHISNSSLNYIYTPWLFKEFFEGTMYREDKSYFKFGQMFHMFVLERKKFEAEIKVMDYTIPRSPQQKQFCEEYVSTTGKVDVRLLRSYREVYTTKETDEKVLEKARALRKALDKYIKFLNQSKKKTVITRKEFAKIEDMYQSVYRHKVARELFFQSPTIVDNTTVHSETMFLWEKDDISYKALIDRIVVEEDTKTIKLIDLKTTVKMSEFSDTIEDYGYGRQLAFYSLALLECGEKVLGLEHPIDDYKLEVIIVPVDKITIETKAIKLKDSTMYSSLKELKKRLDLAKWHIKNKKWSYSRDYYEGDGYETL